MTAADIFSSDVILKADITFIDCFSVEQDQLFGQQTSKAAYHCRGDYQTFCGIGGDILAIRVAEYRTGYHAYLFDEIVCGYAVAVNIVGICRSQLLLRQAGGQQLLYHCNAEILLER